jgi:hypothetical protein
MTAIDATQLLDELEKFSGPPMRQPDDIDRWQIEKKYGENEKQAKARMQRAEKSGEWELLQVYDPDRKHVVAVLRKKA